MVEARRLSGGVKIATLRKLISFRLLLVCAVALWWATSRAESPAPRDSMEAAAERGDPEAEFALGKAYDSGKGVARDPKKAFKYYRRAAEHGNAKAQNNLASLYATGSDGVEKNEAEARKWLRKAAEQGASLAQDNLGLLLARDGDEEATKWFEKSAEQGLLSAQVHLANLLYNGGNGVQQNHARAAKWMRKAADQKSAWAQNVLGVMYLNGFGVQRDPAEAINWFRRAAEQGDAKAESNLGQMLCSGNGVQTNPEQGYKWLTLSAEQNEITAIKFLTDFQTGMTPAQIAAGKKLVEEYKSRRSASPTPGKSDIPGAESH